MTIYIRNPRNSQGALTNSGKHNFVASGYEPVTQYSSEDDGVTYLSSNVDGSGVFVSNYLIVTVQHVVADSNRSFSIYYGPTSANGAFPNTSASQATSKGQAVGSIPASAEVATVTSAAP